LFFVGLKKKRGREAGEAGLLSSGFFTSEKRRRKIFRVLRKKKKLNRKNRSDVSFPSPPKRRKAVLPYGWEEGTTHQEIRGGPRPVVEQGGRDLTKKGKLRVRQGKKKFSEERGAGGEWRGPPGRRREKTFPWRRMSPFQKKAEKRAARRREEESLTFYEKKGKEAVGRKKGKSTGEKRKKAVLPLGRGNLVYSPQPKTQREKRGEGGKLRGTRGKNAYLYVRNPVKVNDAEVNRRKGIKKKT